MEEKEKVCSCCCERHKNTPRSEESVKALKNRINRMSGQLAGISKMLDDNRYCGDILVQIAALESALRAFGYIILKNHLDTCVTEEIKKGNTDITEETLELIKKLK